MEGAARRSTAPGWRGTGALVAIALSLALHVVLAGGGDALPDRPTALAVVPSAASNLDVDLMPIEPLAAIVAEERALREALPEQPDTKPEIAPPDTVPDAPVAPVEPQAPAPEVSPEIDPEVAPPEVSPPDSTLPPVELPSTPKEPAPPQVAVVPGAPDLPAPGSAGEYDVPPGPEGPGMPGAGGLPGMGLPGSSPVWSVPGAVVAPKSLPAPTRAPSAVYDPKAATKALGGTLQTSDKEKGINLPAAGTVVSALSTAVQGTPAPHNARATFEIKVGPNGQVVGARVVKASAGDPAMWDAALKRAQAQIAAKGLAMTGEAAKSGATVRVSVLTRHVFPTGTGKKLELKPQCANGVINELVVAGRKKADQAVEDPNAIPPEVEGGNPFVDANGLPCIPSGISGTIDASNIGAHRQLQVQTQFEVQLADARALPAAIEKVNTQAPWIKSDSAAPRPNNPYAVRKREQKRQKKK